MIELDIDPTNANAAYEVAEIHRKGGDAARARAFFQRALDSYPDFEDALVGLLRPRPNAESCPEAVIPAATGDSGPRTRDPGLGTLDYGTSDQRLPRL